MSIATLCLKRSVNFFESWTELSFNISIRAYFSQFRDGLNRDKIFVPKLGNGKIRCRNSVLEKNLRRRNHIYSDFKLYANFSIVHNSGDKLIPAVTLT